MYLVNEVKNGIQTSLELQAKTLADNLEKDKAALAGLSTSKAESGLTDSGSAKEVARQSAKKIAVDLKALIERIKKVPELIAKITKDAAGRKVQIEELKLKFRNWINS